MLGRHWLAQAHKKYCHFPSLMLKELTKRFNRDKRFIYLFTPTPSDPIGEPSIHSFGLHLLDNQVTCKKLVELIQSGQSKIEELILDTGTSWADKWPHPHRQSH